MKKIDEFARARTTIKLLPDPSTPLPVEDVARAEIDALVACAGWAPFHRPAYAAREIGSGPVEPWRFHMMDCAACRALIPRLGAPGIPEPGKIASMLAAADALIIATWLPEPEEGDGWAANEFNMEHIAAAGAAIQTLLLAATEAGRRSYWSSGGVLRHREVFELLGIPSGECLLGAIFLFPDPPEGVPHASGKMRPRRAAPAAWARWVELG